MRAQGLSKVRLANSLKRALKASPVRNTDFFHCRARFFARVSRKNFSYLFIVFFRRLEYTRERLLEFKKELVTKQDGHGEQGGGGFGGFGGFGGGGEVRRLN